MNLLNVPLINTAKKIVIGIDAKDGMVAIEGWGKKQAILPLLNLQRKW